MGEAAQIQLACAVKAPTCRARRARMAAVEMVSNIQPVRSAGEMKLWPQQTLQLEGSVAASRGGWRTLGEGVQGLQRGSHQCSLQRKSFLHREAVRGCGKNMSLTTCMSFERAWLLMAQGTCKRLSDGPISQLSAPGPAPSSLSDPSPQRCPEFSRRSQIPTVRPSPDTHAQGSLSCPQPLPSSCRASSPTFLGS